MCRLRREHCLLLGILLLGLILRLSIVETRYFCWDETNYIMNSQFFATGKTAYLQLYERPILVSLMIVPFYKSEILIRVFMAMLNSTAVLAIYCLGKKFGNRVGLISALLIAILPFHIFTSKMVITDTISFLFIVITLTFFIGGVDKNKSIYYILGGVFLGLSILLKYTNLLLIPLILVLFILKKPETSKAILAVSATFLIIFPYLLFNRRFFGSWLFPIIQATHVIRESEPVALIVVLSQIILFFGFIIFFALVNIIFRKKTNPKYAKSLWLDRNGKLRYFMIFWLLYGLAYFLLLSQRGIAKPPGMEWEMQRFLFPALAPALILCSCFLSTLDKRKFWILMIIIVIFFMPSYMLALTPSIEFENGLRHVSKKAGEFISQNLEKDAQVYAKENFPVIAYYSQRRTSNKIEELDGKILYSVKIEKKEDAVAEETVFQAENGEYIARVIKIS